MDTNEAQMYRVFVSLIERVDFGNDTELACYLAKNHGDVFAFFCANRALCVETWERCKDAQWY